MTEGVSALTAQNSNGKQAFEDEYRGIVVNVSEKGDYGFVDPSSIGNNSKHPSQEEKPRQRVFIHVKQADVEKLQNGMPITFFIDVTNRGLVAIGAYVAPLFSGILKRSKGHGNCGFIIKETIMSVEAAQLQDFPSKDVFIHIKNMLPLGENAGDSIIEGRTYAFRVAILVSGEHAGKPFGTCVTLLKS